MKPTLQELEAKFTAPLSPEEREKLLWDKRQQRKDLLWESKRTMLMFKKGPPRDSYLAAVKRSLDSLDESIKRLQ